MARVMKQAVVPTAANGLVTILTPAAGKKLEIVDWAVSTGGGGGTAYLLIQFPVDPPGLQFVDEGTLASGKFTFNHAYTGLLALVPQVVKGLWVSSVPANHIVTYIEVDT